MAKEGKDLVPLMGDGGFRSWANVAKFQKMVREVGREGVPPEIGPTVSVREAMALLGRTDWWVRARIADGRLNAWKDPVSGRLYVRLEEVEWLRARQGDKETRRQGDRETAAVEREDEEDDGKPWSWDDVCAAQVVDDWAAESERRYQARLAELMAELEPDTEVDKRQETGDRRQKQAEAAGRAAVPDGPVPAVVSPVSCLVSPVSCLPVERAFPVGWVEWRQAAAMLDLSKGAFNRLARAGTLERRRAKPGGPWLYDTVEVERVAEARLAKMPRPGRNMDVRWWGSRAEKIELGPFDYWMSAKEAAEMLGVQVPRVSLLCKRGLLLCRQAEPGKRGSRLWIPHTRVVSLMQQPEHIARRARYDASRRRPAAPVAWEAAGIGPLDLRAPSAATHVDHGGFYTARQAALVLGVSSGAVRNLRERGRLEGFHRKPPKPRRYATVGRQYWFFRKADVHALQADPTYARNARRGKEAQRLKDEG